MILEGININSESSYATSQAALSLEQLFKINSVKQAQRNNNSSSSYIVPRNATYCISRAYDSFQS